MEPLAVAASMIRLGFCFATFSNPENVEYLLEVKPAAYAASKARAGICSSPNNDQEVPEVGICDVFEYAYSVINSEQNASVDTARGVYVPTDGQRRVWDGSWISRDSHIQLCVRTSELPLEHGYIIPRDWRSTMSVKRYKLAVSASTQKIRAARKKLKEMSELGRKIES